jgi:N-acetylneuraminate synthase
MLNFENLEKPYLIAEIGINHNGDIQIAKQLIDAAFACGWDCVKFQKREPDVCVPEHQKQTLKDTPWGKMTYLDYRKKVEFNKKQYDYINKYCKEKPIAWTASVWDIDSCVFINNYDTPFLKIPSAKLTDKNLLIEAAKSNKSLIVSTGMSTLKEIDEAVETIRKYGKSFFMLMHTNSVYPTPIKDLNIKCIQTLKERYNCPIGYSGHEYDLEATVFAVATGAVVIERHITLSHNMWGTDQASSLEVMGMDMLQKRIKDVKIILGDGIKKVTTEEEIIRKKLRG